MFLKINKKTISAFVVAGYCFLVINYFFLIKSPKSFPINFGALMHIMVIVIPPLILDIICKYQNAVQILNVFKKFDKVISF